MSLTASLRTSTLSATRPYRMQAAAVLAPAAFVVADLLIYWSGFEVVWKLGIVLVLGYVIMAAFMAFDPQRPSLEWKSAIWLPVWLIGMGIISWQGQVPAPRQPTNIRRRRHVQTLRDFQQVCMKDLNLPRRHRQRDPEIVLGSVKVAELEGTGTAIATHNQE